MSSLIIIPARFASTRFPGKPLVDIAGQSMLARVVAIAKEAASQLDNTNVLVATDDDRILAHAKELNVEAVMTSADCASGSDRCYAAIQQLTDKPTWIVGLQGDVPLLPPQFIVRLVQTMQADNTIGIATPAIRLTWTMLDDLRHSKQQSASSGTTVVFDKQHHALWFSKQIIPAIRNEQHLRQQTNDSPVYQHIGLYAYTRDMLETYVNLPVGYYEELEGLEQLRLLENSYNIRVVPMPERYVAQGVDTAEDAERVATIIANELY